MFHTIKRHVSLFILVGALGAVPVLANPVRNAENIVLDFQGSKNIMLGQKFLLRDVPVSYRLTLKEGETVVFTARSSKQTSMKVQAPSGAVNQGESANQHKAILTGAGEYVVELTAEDFSLYTIDVTRS